MAQTPPFIHQFTVHATPTGWAATARYAVTDGMLAQRCRSTVEAPDLADLALDCMVERVKATLARATVKQGLR